jgi:thioester reductase-like protein
LPSATDYGRGLVRLDNGAALPRVTTGHASTTAAVVLAINRILAEAGRDLSRERMAFLGLGSIGSAALALLLESRPHPAEILLCDVYSKREALHRIEMQVRGVGYRGPVRICEAGAELLPGVYDATLFVGATNVPDILDVDRLAPGTLIVDDSAPHCFRTDAAIRRLRTRCDTLFTEGGTLWTPQPIRQTVYLPEQLEHLARALPRELLPLDDPRQITGCILSSLLSTRFPNLPPTVGLIEAKDASEHRRALAELNFQAAPLHCDHFTIDPATIGEFRDRFGQPPPERLRTTPPEFRGFDWFAETHLDPSITANGLAPSTLSEPREILLTGATGFLGAFLLDELLRQTAARIHCLARAESDGDALQRVRRNLDQYGVALGDRWNRIVPIAGDLAQPRLGLGGDRFAGLAARLDSIYHNGAQVHFLHPYATLKPANVLGTTEVLRLATSSRLKSVHFVSTLSVLSGLAEGRPALEDDRNEHPEELENGYSQSKWVSERLVWAALERGVPSSIYRPGRIIWHSRTGALNHDDVLTRALRACIQLGAVPALDATLEMTPVDYVAEAIIALSRNSASAGRAYHIFNSRYVRLRHLLDWVRDAGYPLEVLPADQWLARVQQSATPDAQDALAGLLPLLANGTPFLSENGDDSLLAAPNFNGRNTQSALAGTGVESPEIGPETIQVYLARLVVEGLLSPPSTTESKRSTPATNGHASNRPARTRSHGSK